MPGGFEQRPSTASGQGRGFLRDNAFLVAAGLLPVLVVGFFLLATAIPRWTVPPPAYDLIVKGYKPYSGDFRLKVSYDLDVRDGRLQLTVRPLATEQYQNKPVLFFIDHRTLDARALPLTLRETPPDAPETTVIDPVPGRVLLDGAKAPDGYTLEPRPYHSTGILGDLFGMHSYQAGLVLINRGRVIPLALPEPLDSQAYFVAWVSSEGGR
jgi:hypothetical protein